MAQGDEALASDRPVDAAVAQVAAAPVSNGHDPASIFRSLTSRFGGRLDVKLTTGLFALDGQTQEAWLVVDGLDAAEWTAHTMEALACARD